MGSFQLERVARRLFFYQHEMDEMKNQIDVIRRKNEALIYNILPAHVAKLFIGGRRKDEVRMELLMSGPDCM